MRACNSTTKRLLLASACMVVTTIGTASAALAQAQTESGSELQEVVVTASRVERQGFTAPTPTTVLGQQEMAVRPPQSVVNLINEIPAFRPSSTQTSRPAFQGSGPVSADLRGLGNRRTLTLVDNNRFVPSAANGVVDLNLIPTNMIERTEVVTGGASAAWGSDAVSGVVNLITKKHFEGVDGQLSWGQAQAGDNTQYQGNLTLGGKVGEKGHFVAGFEYGSASGIKDTLARDWGRQEVGTVTYPATANRGNDPSRLIVGQVRSLQNGTFGGVIQGQVLANGTVQNAATTTNLLRSYLNANGYNLSATQNISFGPGGTIVPFNQGQMFGTSTVGGGFYGESGGRLLWLAPELQRYIGMANFEYELTPKITANLQVNVGRSEVYFQTASRRDVNQPSTTLRPAGLPASQFALQTPVPVNGIAPVDYLLIQRDNAYLPAVIRNGMQANNINALYLGRTEFDLGMANGHASNEVFRGVASLAGEFGSTWKWNASWEMGRNQYYQPWDNEAVESRWNKSVDSVIGPSGQPICRVNLPNSPNPDTACVPYNPFGYQSTQNQAAVNQYIMGVLIQDTTYRQQYGEANLSGEPVSTWAGPVSIAVGASWRQDKVRQVSDAISQATDFDNQNPKAYAGSYTAKEIYGETVIPLLKDQPFFKSLEFNGAARRTDYSTSGAVTTWKAGATWSVNEDVRFRGAISRDIRAPNLLELYGIATAVSGVTNPYTRVASGTIQQVTGGNPNLQPERALSKTFGVVFEPHFIPRFRMSIDYYKIKIDGAIATYTQQFTTDRCKVEADAGAPGFFCSQLNTNGQYNNNFVIFGLNTIPFNLVKQTAEGIDFEAQYSLPLGPGNLDLRGFATYSADLTNYDVTARTQYSGYLEFVFNGLGGTPHWLGTLNTTYTVGKAMVSLQSRYIGGAKISTQFIGPDDPNYSPALSNSINVNYIKNRVYFTLSGTYDIIKNDGHKLQTYFVIDNLLNKDPPYYLGSGAGTNGQFYDTIGRAFKVGARFSF
jgi:outer membrane receptor protein involved in Fe transport